jgi:acetyl-CoA C-acetyltransferase
LAFTLMAALGPDGAGNQAGNDQRQRDQTPRERLGSGSASGTGPLITVYDDEGIRPSTTVETLSQLKPAFAKGEQATITAGSSTPLSDGAAALVIASKAAAEMLGLEWIAEIGAHGQTAGPDGSLHSQPSRAIEAALKR